MNLNEFRELLEKEMNKKLEEGEKLGFKAVID